MLTVSTRRPADPVARLRLAFDSNPLALTVGAEEELMIVDEDHGAPIACIADVLSRVGPDPRFKAEFRQCQVEIVSPPRTTSTDVARDLAFARIDLATSLPPGARLLACGVHPTASGPGPVTAGERYRAIAAENPWVRRHTLACGLHVHVAAGDADRSLAVYNALRSYLPELAAIAANSPFHRAEDTGLASARARLNSAFPRHGVPPAFASWDEYAAFDAWGRAGGLIPDASRHWWDLRLHPVHGTIELRVCDAQTELGQAEALVALTQRLVAELAARADDGEALAVHDTHRIGESLELATRDGVHGSLVDLDTGRLEPASERICRLLESLGPRASERGLPSDRLDADHLVVTDPATMQRRVARAVGMPGLVEHLARRTGASASEYLRRGLEAGLPGRRGSGSAGTRTIPRWWAGGSPDGAVPPRDTVEPAAAARLAS